MVWETELAPGDVVDLEQGKILITRCQGGSRIRIHADRSVAIRKNGRSTAEATQEGFGPNDNTRE